MSSNVDNLCYYSLNPFERDILESRPVNPHELHRLWKSTLLRFLRVNRMYVDARISKSSIVDITLNLINSQQGLVYGSDPDDRMLDGSHDDDNSTNSDSDSVRSCEDCGLPSTCCDCQMDPHGERCPCLDCNSQLLNPYESDPEHNYATGNGSHINIFTCHALQHSSTYQEGIEDPMDYCNCDCVIEDILANANLHGDAKTAFLAVADYPRQQIIDILQNYGKNTENIACRVKLLIMARDLFREQYQAAVDFRTETPASSSQDAEAGAGNGSSFAGTSQDMTAAEDTLKLCCICIQNPREIAFVPCGHMISCKSCAKRLKECGVCRKKIVKRLKVFLS